MMRKGLLSSLISLSLLIFCGCTNPDELKISDQSYFPLRVGNFQIYDVSEADIQHLSCSDQSTPINSYQLKVLVYDSIKNSEGGYTYNIHRYTRSNGNASWSDLDSWSARVTSNRVVMNEGNVPYVKLVFPMSQNGTWNANVYNTQEVEYDSIKNFRKPYVLGNNVEFLNTVTVLQIDNRDYFVYRDKRFEIYAPSVGLIYKEVTQLEYFQDPCYGEQKVKTGKILIQSLVGYGHE